MYVSKIDIEGNAEIAYQYLVNKKYWLNGYLKYGIFKRTISFAIKNDSEYALRKIFVYLVENNLILKKKNKLRSYNYKLKNPNESSEQIDLTISF